MAEDWQLPRTGTLQDPLRLAVFISGSGSGMEALIRYQQSRGCLHTTNVVISDKPGIAGLGKAESLGITAIVVPLPESNDSTERRLIHEQEVNEVLADYGVEAIILSGYMRILTPSFVKPWAGRILNIHPSLLPDFPGAHAHRDVIAAKATKSGCTVHFVDSGMDSGPIIAQEEVEVLATDDEESLAQKVKEKEHLLYPMVIDMLSAGEIESP
tara:strand:- start:541 stop:1179 length:639 start_codon:yes stop_codon:yes gene_type:complete